MNFNLAAEPARSALSLVARLVFNCLSFASLAASFLPLADSAATPANACLAASSTRRFFRRRDLLCLPSRSVLELTVPGMMQTMQSLIHKRCNRASWARARAELVASMMMMITLLEPC